MTARQPLDSRERAIFPSIDTRYQVNILDRRVAIGPLPRRRATLRPLRHREIVCDFARIDGGGSEVRRGSGCRNVHASTVLADLFSHRSSGGRTCVLRRESEQSARARSEPSCPPVDTRLPLFFAVSSVSILDMPRRSRGRETRRRHAIRSIPRPRSVTRWHVMPRFYSTFYFAPSHRCAKPGPLFRGRFHSAPSAVHGEGKRRLRFWDFIIKLIELFNLDPRADVPFSKRDLRVIRCIESSTSIAPLCTCKCVYFSTRNCINYDKDNELF